MDSLMDEQVSETQKWVNKYVNLTLNEDCNSPQYSRMKIHLELTYATYGWINVSGTYYQMKKCFKI